MFKHWKTTVVFSLLSLMTVVSISSQATGASRITLQPLITVSHEYDDNIYLDRDNRKSDHITMVSPQIILKIDSDRTTLDLGYSPTWVRYHEYSDKDTVRHRGTLNFWQKFGDHWNFNVEESYLKSEDIFESFEPGPVTQILTHTRKPYQRNDASASLDYEFAPECHLTVGYSHRLLKHEDPSSLDTTEQGPFGRLSYWFNVKNGIELGYQFTRYKFEQEQGVSSRDDFDGHQADARYTHRFSPHTSAYLVYLYTVRSAREKSEDYRVHEGRAGLEHDFSPYTSLSAEAGYYDPEGTAKGAGGGFSFSASLSRKIEHGNITLKAEKGWDEGYLDLEPRGFTRYLDSSAGIEYTLLKDLDSYAGVSYRENKYFFEQSDDKTYAGQCGLTLKVLRWLSVGLNYTHRDRRSDDPNDEYVDNRVMITISAWQPDPFHW